jgi:hypothetical protein
MVISVRRLVLILALDMMAQGFLTLGALKLWASNDHGQAVFFGIMSLISTVNLGVHIVRWRQR